MVLQARTPIRPLLMAAAPLAAALVAYLAWPRGEAPQSGSTTRLPREAAAPETMTHPSGFGPQGGVTARAEETADLSPSTGSRPSSAGPATAASHQPRTPAAATPEPPPHIVLGCGLPGPDPGTGQPRRVRLEQPADVAVGPEGTIAVLDAFRVLAVRPDGSRVMPLVGGKRPGLSADGTPAREAFLTRPSDIAFDDAGQLHVVDGPCIRFIDAEGRLETLAGDPMPPAPGRVGRFVNLRGLVFDRHGRAFTCDMDAHRVFRIDGGGRVEPVAGNGTRGFGGDGGPALEASLDSPSGVAVADDGSLFIADLGNNAIRVISPDGTIRSLVAPSPTDAAPASRLERPEDLVQLANGSLLVTDASSFIHRVAPDGQISVAAGRLVRAVRGLETVLAPDVFSGPRGLALDPQGNLLVADRGHYTIKRVAAALLTGGPPRWQR